MLDESTISELKAKHGENLELHETALGDVVLKTPPEPEWRRFVSRIRREKDSTAAIRDLVSTCVVHPDAEGVRELRKQKPAFDEAVCLRLQELAGEQIITEGKKL